jgi:hypothetical protein
MNVKTESPRIASRMVRFGAGAFVVLAVAAAGLWYFVPSVREWTVRIFGPQATIDPDKKADGESLTLVRRGNDVLGLRLTSDIERSFGIVPTSVQVATDSRALPPQLGTLNYDADRLFVVRPRFQGELMEIRQVPEIAGMSGYRTRPLRFGDSVKQGDELAVLWCKDLGEKKAALVDAVISYRLSADTVDRQKPLLEQGSMSLASFKASEKQLQSDANTVLTAERTLKMWKLTEEEIDGIRKEANTIVDQKKKRDSSREKDWAKLIVTAPKFSSNPNQDLVVLEKNTSIGDFVDPGRDTPLFRLADLTRLQVWVHPSEEYLPLLREVREAGGRLDGSFASSPTRCPLRSKRISRSSRRAWSRTSIRRCSSATSTIRTEDFWSASS